MGARPLVAASAEPNIAKVETRDTPQFRALPAFARFVDADLRTVGNAEFTAQSVLLPPCLERARAALQQALAAHPKAYHETFRLAKAQVSKAQVTKV